MAEKNYNKLVKILQVASGIFMIGMIVVCVVLMKKYNIKVTNIPDIADMLKGNRWVILAIGLVIFNVVKSFALIFPPAVVLAVCAYLMPNYFIALAVNIISVFLSLSIPYFLGKFTGASMIDTLKGKYKAIKKLDDFAGANEIEMTFAVKLSGLLPSDLSSLIFGAMGISYKNYMIGSNLGMLPIVIAYTFFGCALKYVAEIPWIVALPVVIVVVFVIISGLITKRLIKKTKERNEKAGIN